MRRYSQRDIDAANDLRRLSARVNGIVDRRHHSPDTARIAALGEENARLREALKPFAETARRVDELDDSFPDDGACLRANLDWYDSESGQRQSLRWKAFREATTALEQKP